MSKLNKVQSSPKFPEIENSILEYWDEESIFQQLREKNSGNKRWSFIDGPITANNPMGVHHAWGRTLKDLYQRYHAMNGYDLRYQNGFDCQGLWVEVEVEKELGFKTKREVEEHGIENFVKLCKQRVEKFSTIQTEQSKRLGYWMDWDNSYFTMSEENNYAIWGFLKKLFNKGKLYKGTDVVPWSGKSGTSYSQMEIIEGRKLVAHKSVFVKFPVAEKKNEFFLVWTTTPWTLTSNVALAINSKLDYLKVEATDSSIYYFAKENLKFQRLERQFKDKKLWIQGIPKLKTIEQFFNERGGYKVIGEVKGKDLVGLKYIGVFDELPAQRIAGGHPFKKEELSDKNITAVDCHRVLDGGKDAKGGYIVVSGEGTGIVHIAPGCGAIDNKLGNKNDLVNISPLDDESKYIDSFDWLTGKSATSKDTIDSIIDNLKEKGFLFAVEKYPHVYPHCWRSGDELVYRMVDEWYINMDWRDDIKKVVKTINWIPDWGKDREMEWLSNMGDWMISKKRFWGLALPIWVFEDGSFYVVGSKKELEELAIEGWDEFKGNTPHRPWIDKVKIKHPDSGLIGSRIPDVGNPWLDAGIVPFSTLGYDKDRKYWEKWFPADFVVECFPGQFRNWFYSLLAMSTMLENTAPFKLLLGHALVKDQDGREMHKSWGNAIWFDDAAEKMGVDVMRWMYASQNPEQNLLFGYSAADEVRKNIITLWNVYSFFVTYSRIDGFHLERDYDLQDLEKIDRWIISKVNLFIKNAGKYYEKFQVYLLMEEATKLLNNISNWYVRRNRRRFWKSENDTNKETAYYTLYTVIYNYIKVLSPVVPFITEEIYLNLSKIGADKKFKSIHLSPFPVYEDKLIDHNLINEVDSLIQIVSLGRSARSRANIKVRQPLEEVIIYGGNKIGKVVKNNVSDIVSELNVKNVRMATSYEDLLDYAVKPNFISIKEKFKNVNEIIKLINQVSNKKLIQSLNKNGKIVFTDLKEIELLREDFLIEELPKENISISSNNTIIVGIKTIITEDLKLEGIARDLIRAVQNLRKKSDFNIEDRIILSIEGDSVFNQAISKNKSYFMNEILATKVNFSVNNNEFHEKNVISNFKVEIAIEKTN